LQAELDAGGGAGDFAGDKSFAATRRFVVEKDAVAGVQLVGFAVIDGEPVCVNLGAGVRRAGPEGGLLGLRYFLDLAEHFGGGGLVETDFAFQSCFADGFEDADGAQTYHIAGVFGDVEGDANVALSAEVVNFIRLQRIEQLDQHDRIGEVAIVKKESGRRVMGIGVKVIDAFGVEGGGAANDTVDFVSFFKEEFSEVGSVLAGDAGNECFLHMERWLDWKFSIALMVSELLDLVFTGKRKK